MCLHLINSILISAKFWEQHSLVKRGPMFHYLVYINIRFKASCTAKFNQEDEGEKKKTTGSTFSADSTLCYPTKSIGKNLLKKDMEFKNLN